MKKQIDAQELKNIANRFALFNVAFPMELAVSSAKVMIETIDKHTENGKVEYEFVDFPTLYRSDYYHDYDGSLYKDKKPPFVCALLENLVKNKKSSLAPGYAEQVVEFVLQQAEPKAQVVIQNDKIMETKFDLFSGELVATSHMDLPLEFSDIFREILTEFKGSINTIEGATRFTQFVEEKYKFGLFTTDQQKIFAFKKPGEIMFGEVNYKNFDENKVELKYKDKPFVTDENCLILIDRYQMVDLIAKKTGKPKARSIVEQFLTECPWVLHNVKSDEYIVKFTPDIEQLQKLDNQQEYPEINQLFVLRSKTLDNELKQQAQFKNKNKF